ncbi:glutathione S-transferase family protein [Aureimonas phyllosphaerae]|uniref:glutathione S-transferase family protein n=1 Tax=Aureimonas phyllosphaerae TaxID=1166078 RepID=UPI003A5B9402
MRILTNTTSPYARIARIALGEKGFDLSGTEIVNPWSDDPGLLALNSAARVPTLETDEGLPITESLLVVLWLERKVPEPSLLSGPLDRTISLAGRAMGVVDAMANIVTNRMQVDPNFGEHRVGLKRRRTIVEGMRQLERDPPDYDGGTPSIAVIASVVALDYLALRFPGEPWVEAYPQLEALRAQVADRPAFATTVPSL